MPYEKKTHLPAVIATPLGDLDAFIRAANAAPLLTAEEERKYAVALRDKGDVNAAQALVISHLRLVISVARGYLGYGLPHADLIQEGNIGLMKAIKHFDPDRGVRLMTFAVHWIRAEIQDYVVKNWRLVKLATTKNQRKLFFNLRQMKESDKALTYGELSHAAIAGDGRGQMVAHGSYVTTASSVPYGAHFAQVAVNVRTGEIKVQKFYALQDAGTPINPEIALCQMYGAAMKSIGHTLYEDMKLDENGKCINANLTDYGAPMIGEAPEDFKSVLIDVNDDFGPFGAKSISEIACNGAAPAIGIAIHDACGVWMRSWPMTPEKLLHELGRI